MYEMYDYFVLEMFQTSTMIYIILSFSFFSGNCTTPGYYRNPATNQCEQCPLGTYNSEKWMDQCTDCPSSYTTPSVGSETLDDCERK